MRVYLVIYNGKVSNEAYATLKEAKEFCIRRGAFENIYDSWTFVKGKDVYQITDVQVNTRTSPNEEVRE